MGLRRAGGAGDLVGGIALTLSALAAPLLGVRDPRSGAGCRSSEPLPPTRGHDIVDFDSVVAAELSLALARYLAQDA